MQVQVSVVIESRDMVEGGHEGLYEYVKSKAVSSWSDQPKTQKLESRNPYLKHSYRYRQNSKIIHWRKAKPDPMVVTH